VPTELCRAKTPEGEFLRSAGIHKQWVTSSGYFTCVSAGGKALGHFADEKALAAFLALPEAGRKPGAVEVAALAAADASIPSPPAGGLVLRVHGRFMARGAGGELRHATPADFVQIADKPASARSHRLFMQPNTERMWLTEAEWKSLIPADPVKGVAADVPAAIVGRIASFHLSPRRALTSEDGIVPKREVKTARLTLTVEEVTAGSIRLRASGFVQHGAAYDAARATTPNGPLGFGYEARLDGLIEYDRVRKAITRFDLVAPGDVWGRWGDANGKSQTVERPGRGPVGFAFELASGGSPSDRLPPGGHGGRAIRAGYFAAK